jgi:hypothetical protein
MRGDYFDQNFVLTPALDCESWCRNRVNPFHFILMPQFCARHEWRLNAGVKPNPHPPSTPGSDTEFPYVDVRR